MSGCVKLLLIATRHRREWSCSGFSAISSVLTWAGASSLGNWKKISNEISGKVTKISYLDVIEGPTRSTACCERPIWPTRVLRCWRWPGAGLLVAVGGPEAEPSAGAGSDVARCAPSTGGWKSKATNPRRWLVPRDRQPWDPRVLHQVVLLAFRPSSRPITVACQAARFCFLQVQRSHARLKH